MGVPVQLLVQYFRGFSGPKGLVGAASYTLSDPKEGCGGTQAHTWKYACGRTLTDVDTWI